MKDYVPFCLNSASSDFFYIGNNIHYLVRGCLYETFRLERDPRGTTTGHRISKVRFPPELEDVADIISVIPILGNIPKAIAAFAKLSQSAAQWINQQFDRGGIAQLQQMDALELLRTMPKAMARDLEEMMGDEHHRGKNGDFRISVIFDGFERLAEHTVDDWFVRELCSEAVMKRSLSSC